MAGLALVAAVVGVGRLEPAGSPEPGGATIPATTTTTTTVPGAPPPPPAPPVVRSEADVDEPLCESRHEPPAGSGAGDAPSLATLESLMSVVNTYGVPFGEEFHGAGMTWTDDGRRVVIAAFVANVAEHRDALHDLIDPDHVTVCRARLTRSEAATIVAEVEPLLVDAGLAYGPSGMEGLVDVDLRAGNEQLAESLRENYGDQLALTLGAFPYPMPDPLPEPTCRDLPPTSADLPYAVEQPDPVALTAADGMDTNVEVPFVNATSEHIEFTTGVPVPYLADPESGDVVGVVNAGVAFVAIGIIVDLQPGDLLDQGVHVPTASCDPALGHTLPPGEYHLYAVNSIDADKDFAVGPVPVTIIEQ